MSSESKMRNGCSYLNFGSHDARCQLQWCHTTTSMVYIYPARISFLGCKIWLIPSASPTKMSAPLASWEHTDDFLHIVCTSINEMQFPTSLLKLSTKVLESNVIHLIQYFQYSRIFYLMLMFQWTEITITSGDDHHCNGQQQINLMSCLIMRKIFGRQYTVEVKSAFKKTFLSKPSF